MRVINPENIFDDNEGFKFAKFSFVALEEY